MVKAIIFDCFGVLATEAWLPFKAKYFGHDPELFKKASEIGHQADKGSISYDDCMKAIAKLAGITPEQAVEAIAHNVPDEELFAYVRELKKDYKLGLLSNVAGNYLHQIFTTSQLSLFDAIALSFESGFIKPQAEAFGVMAKQLGVDLNECVFIDDQQRNVNGAITAGMPAIVYHDAAKLQRELSKLLS